MHVCDGKQRLAAGYRHKAKAKLGSSYPGTRAQLAAFLGPVMCASVCLL